jgi:hypothetical protein
VANGKFNVEIDKAFAKVDKYLDNFMNEFKKDFMEELVYRTPVYPVEGGFLQSNWRVGANTKTDGKQPTPTGKERSAVPSSAQESLNQAASVTLKNTDTMIFSNDTQYAQAAEYGVAGKNYAGRNFTSSTVAIADQIAAKTKARLKK